MIRSYEYAHVLKRVSNKGDKLHSDTDGRRTIAMSLPLTQVALSVYMAARGPSGMLVILQASLF